MHLFCSAVPHGELNGGVLLLLSKRCSFMGGALLHSKRYSKVVLDVWLSCGGEERLDAFVPVSQFLGAATVERPRHCLRPS